jgi:hypothetical protein
MGEAHSESPRTSSQPGSTPTRRRLTNDPESTARRARYASRRSSCVNASHRRAKPRPNVLLRVAETKRRMPVRREDKGASAGGLTWGGASRSRELRPESDPLFLAPLLALFHPGCLVRERPESGGIGCCLRPTPTLRPHCPIYSSSDSTASGKALTVDPSTEKPCKQAVSSGASRGPHSRSRHSSNSRQSFFLFGAPALSE